VVGGGGGGGAPPPHDRGSSGCSRPDGVAYCSAQLDSRPDRAVAPPSVPVQNRRHRRDCCPPVGNADPASATAGADVLGRQGHCRRQAADSGAARWGDVAEPPDAPPQDGRAAQGYSSGRDGRPRGAQERPDAQELSGAPLASLVAGGPVGARPVLESLDEVPARHCRRARTPAGERAQGRDQALRWAHPRWGESHWSHPGSRGHRPMHRWSGAAYHGQTACLSQRETSRGACGRPVPPPLRRQTSHTHRGRRVFGALLCW
jgi:hypothetical protein